MHEALRPQARHALGRWSSPHAAILDSPSVKTTDKGGPGLRRGQAGDGPQTASGRGYPGSAAGGGAPRRPRNRDGARRVRARLGNRFPHLQRLWADAGYAGPKLGDWVRANTKLDLGHHPPFPTGDRLPGPASALGGGAHLCLAGTGGLSGAAPKQGLRGTAGNHRSLDPGCHDRPRAAPPGTNSIFLNTPSDTGATAVRKTCCMMLNASACGPRDYWLYLGVQTDVALSEQDGFLREL